MNSTQIEENVKSLLQDFNSGECEQDAFIYELLLSYGHRKQSVSRLRSGERNIASKENTPLHGTIIWKRHLYFKHIESNDLYAEIDKMRNETLVGANKTRFIIVTNYDQLLAFDTKIADSLDISLDELPKQFDFFLPWANMEKAIYQGENPADVKAAEKMAKLFDLIKEDNFDESNKNDTNALHNLNVFLTRLLFCFFAEDTEIFEENQFSLSIKSHTNDNGSDLSYYLNRLFCILNTSDNKREELPDYLASFPYVNGGLFSNDLSSPVFSARSRRMLIECGSELDWSDINPDIFGSMIQAVVHPDQRGGLGMHYTSVTNIMKVIEPLFLNSLYEELDKIESNKTKLQQLQQRLGEVKIFDPACGSGNFLIIAYKELRKLEIEILKQLQEIELKKSGQIFQPFSVIRLSQFYGIELDDFAHEVAILSLWLAEHQMNIEFKTEFGEVLPSLPLKNGGEIICENALRIEWRECVDLSPQDEVYIIGNPPYLGSKNQSEDQKEDIKYCLKGISNTKSLDYIACWFIKAASFINSKSAFSFVSTNSICQGTQVPLLWPIIIKDDREISFAYKNFVWSNNARNKAGVTCSIIGIRYKSDLPKYLFSNELRKEVRNINPYLIESANIVVAKSSHTISNLPRMQIGNEPYESGHLIFTEIEKESFVQEDIRSKKFFKKLVGSNEFIKGTYRWCLWIENEDVTEAKKIPSILDRIGRVYKSRLAGGMNARSCANRPHQFRWVNRAKETQIIVPVVSSERRKYIPVGFVDKEIIISNKAQVIFDPEPYVFGMLNSRIHMAWVRTITGRIRTDYQYTAGLCYNSFPFPLIDNDTKSLIFKKSLGILSVRESYPDMNLGRLYDPDKMPLDLKSAHAELDKVVDKVYRKSGFSNDDERLEYLFKMYSDMTEGKNAKSN